MYQQEQKPQLYSISKSGIRKSHLIKTILFLIEIYIHCDIKKEQDELLKQDLKHFGEKKHKSHSIYYSIAMYYTNYN